MQRRAFIAGTGASTASFLLSGCVSQVSGTKDLVVNNCLDGDATDGNGDRTADIRIRREGSNGLIFDETVTVPGMSCSDVVDGVDREDVFPEAGTYTIVVTVDEYDPVEQQVEFSEREIADNSDNTGITIRDDDIEIV